MKNVKLSLESMVSKYFEWVTQAFIILVVITKPQNPKSTLAQSW